MPVRLPGGTSAPTAPRLLPLSVLDVSLVAAEQARSTLATPPTVPRHEKLARGDAQAAGDLRQSGRGGLIAEMFTHLAVDQLRAFESFDRAPDRRARRAQVLAELGEHLRRAATVCSVVQLRIRAGRARLWQVDGRRRRVRARDERHVPARVVYGREKSLSL